MLDVVSRRCVRAVAGDLMGAKMEILELELPTHWAIALVNSDESGLDDDDQKRLDRFVDAMVSEFGACWCLDVGADSWFQTCHDATRFGVLACEVSTFSFDVTQRGRANV